MKIARAVAISSLVPLVGVAVVGIGAGSRSIVELGQFVLIWAIFLYPLAFVLTLGFYFLSRWCGIAARWQFAVVGLLGGAALALSWGPLQPADGASPVLPTLVFCSAGGIVGAATAGVFWQLAIGARAA